jgi:hypothetical protein
MHIDCFAGGSFLFDPAIPQNPAEDRTDATPSDDCDGRDALLENTNEADDKYNNGADMLDYNSRVRNQRPEVVRLKPRIPLEMFEKGILIGIIVRVCGECY